MKQKLKNIDEYIASFPEEVQSILQKIRLLIAGLAPEATESISYGIPCYKQGCKYLVYFAGYKNHVSIYPVPTGDAGFQKTIAKYQTGKGTLQFQLDEPIPYDLIEKIVKLRLIEQSLRNKY